jgi:hypothetical protein
MLDVEYSCPLKFVNETDPTDGYLGYKSRCLFPIGVIPGYEHTSRMGACGKCPIVEEWRKDFNNFFQEEMAIKPMHPIDERTAQGDITLIVQHQEVEAPGTITIRDGIKNLTVPHLHDASVFSDIAKIDIGFLNEKIEMHRLVENDTSAGKTEEL